MSVYYSDKNLGKWAVEVGKGSGAYQTRYAFPSDQPVMAEVFYNGINVFGGYKKRLVNPNGEVVLRIITRKGQ